MFKGTNAATCTRDLKNGNNFTCICSEFNITKENEILPISCSFPVKILRFQNSTISFLNPSTFIKYRQSLDLIILDDLQIKYMNYSGNGYGTRNISFMNNSLQEFPKLNIPNLEILHLEYNKIVDISVITKSLRLKEIYLSFNKIYSLSPRTFSYLRFLKILKMDNNQITEIPKAIFKKNFDLEEIDLKSNKIFYMDSDFYKSLPEDFDLRVTDNICPAVKKKFTIPSGDEMPEKIIDTDYVIKVRNGNTTKLTKDLSECFRYLISGNDHTLSKQILEAVRAGVGIK